MIRLGKCAALQLMRAIGKPIPRKIFSEVRISSRYSRSFPDHLAFVMQMRFSGNFMVRGFGVTNITGPVLLSKVTCIIPHKSVNQVRCRYLLYSNWDAQVN